MQEVNDPMDLEMQLVSSPQADGRGSGAGQIMHTAILVVKSIQIFISGTNQGSSAFSRVSSSKSIDSIPEIIPEKDEPKFHYVQARNVGMEETTVEIMDEAQATPLLKTVDNSFPLRKQIRTLSYVLLSSLAFKVHGSSPANAFVHHEISGTPEQKSEACEGLAAPPEFHRDISERSINEININQLQRNQSRTVIKIVREKNLQALQKFGGLSGIEDVLSTDLVNGISDKQAISRSRQHEFYQPAPAHTFFHAVWKTSNDKTVLLLLLAAALSVFFGIKEEGLQNGCYDGVVVLIAIVLIVFLGSIRKYWEEQTARKKLQKQRSHEGSMGDVHVRREDQEKYICASKLVCGDVVLLKKGCQVPADGLFVEGQALELDCGSETNTIDEQNPFLSYGDRVINGDGRMVVTSTNMDTSWSEMMRNATGQLGMNSDLETHVDKLNTCMHYTGLIISILIILVLFFRYKAGKMDEENGYKPESISEPTGTRYFTNMFRKIIKDSKYTTRVLIKLLSVSLVGLTEGVPFVVSLAIHNWKHDILCGEAIEQESLGVSQVASITRICTGTFGNFTKDEMEVEKLIIGGEVISGCATLSPDVLEALCDGIGTLKQLSFFHWAKYKLGFKKERMIKKQEILNTEEMNPFEGPCGVLMSGIEESKELILHFSGPVKNILSMSKHYYNSKGQKILMDDEATLLFQQHNEDMQHEKLGTIAFACKRTDSISLDANDLVLVAILGLKNKIKEDTESEVEACRERGIKTILVSSKNISILQDIAHQCRILSTIDDSESLVVRGEVFRKYTHQERLDKADKIGILGEALPSDKLLLVETLRKKGHMVAFLGQRTDEAPSLRGADIGIAMGTWSSIKAIESCDFFLRNGSFSDLIRMVDYGKCIYHNIQRFLQLVLITTISSTLISFSETVFFGDVSLTTLQFVWVKLAVAVLGGFALLTNPHTDKPLSLLPVRCKTSIITAEMIRNIVFQVLYQVICLLVIQFKGSEVVDPGQDMKTVVSNIFIFCQFFNQFNARELQKKNFFRGIHNHIEFWVAIAMFIVFHALFIMVQVFLGYGSRLNWKLWAGCVLFGVVTWKVDWVGKCISCYIKIIFKRVCA